MLKNYKLIIRYDGTRYKGWEHQPGTDMTIQGKMELAVIRMLNPSGKASFQEGAGNSEVNAGRSEADVRNAEADTRNSEAYDVGAAAANGKALQSAVQDCAAGRNCLGSFEGDIPEIISAGRTDGGVHAIGMCANVHLDTGLNCTQIRDGLNRNLPDDICVTNVEIVPDRFHARYNATGKTYRYTCYAGELKPVFDRRYCYELGSVPDIGEMRRAAGYIIGEHDFTSFCGNPKMKKSCVRCVDRIDIEYSDERLTFTYHGTGFLQYMVRIMTGTLLEVGLGKRSSDSVPDILEARDRSQAGFTAPARGLSLVSVDY